MIILSPADLTRAFFVASFIAARIAISQKVLHNPQSISKGVRFTAMMDAQPENPPTKSPVVLWSWLTRSSATREINCPPTLTVSLEQFLTTLRGKLSDNQLPAVAKVETVNWDDTGVNQNLIVIGYTGPDPASDILRFTVGLEQLGRFAYLEKRIILVPPLIHKARAEKSLNQKSGSGIAFAALGSIMLIFGLLLNQVGGAVCAVPGLALLVIGLWVIADTDNKNKEIVAWNQETKAERESLTKNLDEWETKVLTIGFLGQTNDFYGRWTSAISTTIDQVIQKLFIDQMAEASVWDEQQRSKEEIENELKKRRQEAFQ